MDSEDRKTWRKPVGRNPRFSSLGLWCCPLWIKYLLQPSVRLPLWLCMVFTANMFGLH